MFKKVKFSRFLLLFLLLLFHFLVHHFNFHSLFFSPAISFDLLGHAPNFALEHVLLKGGALEFILFFFCQISLSLAVVFYYEK